MKRMVAVAIMAVLACTLFLVPYTSAAICKVVIIDTWVEKPSGEVLDEFSYGDVNDNYTYNVKLEIEASFRPISVNANLTFGPNNDSINCHENRTKSGKVSIGETTTTISFVDLSFLPLADCDDEFKEFTDGKRGWEWDKCWYKFDVSGSLGDISCEGAETELKSGIPMLTRYTEKFYELRVTPTQGTNIDTFNYSVTVNATVCDKIELQVRNHTSDKWDTKGTREYRTPDINETLTWQEIRLNSHELDRFNDSTYKFVGTFESSESKGPFYPIELRWRTHNVTPNRGLYNHQFNYSIEVYSTRAIEVKLGVDYPHEGEAVISDPMKNYTDRGNWKLICWNGTQPFVEEDEGNATYKFEFYYKDTKINETERYSGPSIGIAIFKDASFEPEIGTGETEFTYRVFVKAVKPDNITLTVYDSKGDKVAERRSKDKTTAEWKLFEFENVPFKVPPASGIATYEFLTGKNTKSSFDGPELIAEEFGELSVSPKEGTNYTPFNFSVDYKTSNPEYVTLWAKCDHKDWVEMERKPVVSEQGTISFSAKTPCAAFEKVCWKCTGIVSESEINCTNWDIGLKWQSRSFRPKEGWWNDAFDFSVIVSANVPGDVVLMAKEDGTNVWVAVGKKPYTGSPNPQTLTWENERIFSTYEGSTSYNFSFYGGTTGYASRPYPGPKLFIPLNISIPSADVIPDTSVSYIENEMLQDNFKNLNIPLTFSSSVSAAKDTSIKLVTIDPSGAETEYEEEKKYYAPGLKTLKWAVESSNFERIGLWNYTFMYRDTRYGWTNYSEVFKGPEIIAVLRDFDIEPEPPLLYGETCDVTVAVNGSRDLTIRLELCNLTSHCTAVQNGTRIYDSSGGEQEMVWKDINPFGETYGSNDGLLFYLDVTWEGENEYGIISGEVTMLPSARNPEVYPTEGNWDATYDYSVEVIFDTAIEVELWVWDPWFSDWTNQGTAHYSATRNWERIYWNATKPFSEECIGSVSKFKFKYAGIDLKERRDGRLVPLVSAGPRIQTTPPRVEFTDGKVSREDATYLDELNYSVNVEASKVMDIELKVYDPCFGMWKSIDIRTAGTGDWKELTWENERPFFDTNCKKGSSKFQFNAYYKGELINKSELYPGPDLIPLIEYTNPKVEPRDGRYNWLFNYSVEIANVTEHVNPEEIKLEVLNPHTLARMTFDQTGRENDTLLWRVRPFIDDSECIGTAKYYFVYGDDRWPDVPCYGPEITPPPPAPVELEGAVESTTAERGDLKMEYYVHTGYVTPFNFTASSNSEVDLELLIRDPVTGGLERKGDLQHCHAAGDVTWSYITPFVSIKADKIADYIGKRFDFTFMYSGEVYQEEFQGPELIVAFKNPKCPAEVIYGDMFEYSIGMIARERLNVTLQYYNGSAWNSVGTKPYAGVKVWDTLTWNCTATEQWQDVRFKWWGDGGGTLMGVLQLDKEMRVRYVPTMVK